MNRPASRAGGRAAAGGGGSAGARGAILLAVAAVLGIVLLQAFDTDFDDGGGVGVDVGITTIPTGGSNDSTVPPAPPATTNTTQPSRAPAEVIVLVANGTGIRGLGGTTTETLTAVGYNTLTAVDATKPLDVTSVQFAESYESEARAIALTLGLPSSAVQPLNSPAVPDTQGANVIVLLGADFARNVTTTTP